MGSLYSDIPSWLHRYSAGFKLVGMALAGMLLLLLASPWMLAGCAVVCAALWFSLGEATRVARRLRLSVLIGAMLVAVFQLWMGRPALAAVSALRLACACSLGVALSTHPLVLLEVLELWLAPLAHLGLRPERMALQLGLMLLLCRALFRAMEKASTMPIVCAPAGPGGCG